MSSGFSMIWNISIFQFFSIAPPTLDDHDRDFFMTTDLGASFTLIFYSCRKTRGFGSDENSFSECMATDYFISLCNFCQFSSVYSALNAREKSFEVRQNFEKQFFFLILKPI